MRRFIVIGGDAAGMSAASQARRGQVPPEVIVYERGSFTSYAACGLPYLVGGVVADPDDLVARTPEEHRARGIDVRLRHEVLAIDVARRVVEVRRLDDGSVLREPFDELLIATGALPVRPAVENVDAVGVTTMHSIPEAVALDRLVASRSHGRAVIVGGGYIGLEMVEAMLLRGLHVTVVEKLPQPMATFDADMGVRVADALRGLGVDLHLGVGVTGFRTADDGRVRAVETDEGELPADLVVLGIGVRPNVSLARDAGITIGPSGAIATDARMRTSAEGVWAAGDCAESFHRVSRRPVSIALGTHANKQGRVVGLNVGGGAAEFPGVLGTAITKVCELELARTGLDEREAAAAGLDAVAATIDATTRASYYPDNAAMTIKVVAERSTGRMLGAQMAGGAGSAKRIDTFAVAVWNEMTVEDFASLDLAYAPPFSPVWDPALIAARRTAAARQ
jgi:NADPH-dependent 2,4-dienoyl-CoA reductase/sulfur reductase-like enzyme